jgi:hypothetical protein
MPVAGLPNARSPSPGEVVLDEAAVLRACPISAWREVERPPAS